MRAPFLLILLFVCLGAAMSRAATNDPVAAAFDQANTLYEQGKFSEAADAYTALAGRGAAPAGLWFNLGNAAYKSGQLGRAIAAYRLAERLTPRDTHLRANLQFVRGKVDERARLPWWKSLVRLATVNEWTVLTAAFFWAAGGLLAWSELSRRRHPKTALLLLGATLLTGAALAAAVQDHGTAREAVVSAREVTVRFGPLDESQSAFQLRDGAEVAVLDAKDRWLQVRDRENRTGWMRRDEAIVLPGVQ